MAETYPFHYTLLLYKNDPDPNKIIERFKILIDKKYDINNWNIFMSSPILHYYLSDFIINYSVLKFLLENGVNVNYETRFVSAPLHSLCRNKSITLDLLQLLLPHIKNINKLDFNTALYVLCHNESITYDLIKEMKEKGAILLPRSLDLFVLKNNSKKEPRMFYLFFDQNIDVDHFPWEYRILLFRYRKILYFFKFKLKIKIEIPLEIKKIIIKIIN